MNARPCCEVAASDSRSEPFAAPATDGEPHPPTFARRCLDIAGWIVSGRDPGAHAEVPARVWQLTWQLGPDSGFRSQPRRL